MRINMASRLTTMDVMQAASLARRDHGQDKIQVSPRGAITFYCCATKGSYSTQRPNASGRAASWTAYGYVIAHTLGNTVAVVISSARSTVSRSATFSASH